MITELPHVRFYDDARINFPRAQAYGELVDVNLMNPSNADSYPNAESSARFVVTYLLPSRTIVAQLLLRYSFGSSAVLRPNNEDRFRLSLAVLLIRSVEQ